MRNVPRTLRPPPADPRGVLGWLPPAAAGLAALVGASILLGWALDVHLLRSGLPSYSEARPIAALCFLLMAAALALLNPPAISAPRRRLGRSFAAAGVAISTMTFVEYAIDRPGSMALGAALAFVLIGGALACLNGEARWQERVAAAFTLAVAVMGSLALVGYLGHVSSLYVGSHLTHMPIPTAIGFVVLAGGIACVRPERGAMRLLTTRGSAGTVVRVLLPTALAVPVFLSLLRLAGEKSGLYDTNTGVWLLVLAIMGLLVPLSLALGATLDRAERARHSEHELSREVQRERVAFEGAPIGSVITDRTGRIERVNAAFCAMTDYRPDDLIGRPIHAFTAPDDRNFSTSVIRRMVRERGGTEHIEKRYIHRSGRVIEAKVSLSTIKGEDGEVVQFFAQIEDVTKARRTSRELEQAQFEMLARLAAAAEFHDDNTGQHTRRVGDLSVAIAKRLNLADPELELIRLAAPLHDVGKIAIPDAVLAKPGRLTSEEFDQMKTHTVNGAKMLSGSAFPLLELAEVIALTHHEKWDGSGYPFGLAGEDIPICGRIVAVADVYDALTHARSYKPAWTAAEAIAEMTSQAGRHFDPVVLAAFLDLVDETPGPPVQEFIVPPVASPPTPERMRAYALAT